MHQNHSTTPSNSSTKTPCKSLKKDGSPCRGNGLPQFDGYCIAHGPADKVREWRALGGANSSTVARLDNRIPNRMYGVINMLEVGMNQVLQGTLTPSAYTAICRGAKELREIYRVVDDEMDAIRAEETHAAAAELAGGHGDLDILETAAEISARQDQYRLESLVAQDLAELQQSSNPDETPETVLTKEGRHRFGYRPKSDFTQEDIDELKEAVEQPTYLKSHLPHVIGMMEEMREEMEEALADLTSDPAPDPEPPRDPLTGQTMDKLPAGAKTGMPLDPDPATVENSPEVLADQIRQVKELIRLVEQQRLDKQYDQKRDSLQSEAYPNGDVIEHSPAPPPVQ